MGVGSGKFEIVSDRVIVKGEIYLIDERDDEEFPEIKDIDSLSKNEIYKEFSRRGYDIGNNLKCLESIESTKNSELL